LLDYDLVVLAVAIAFLTRHGLQHGFRNYEVSLLAAARLMLRRAVRDHAFASEKHRLAQA